MLVDGLQFSIVVLMSSKPLDWLFDCLPACCCQAEAVVEKKLATQLAVKLKEKKFKNVELNRRVIAAHEALGKANVSALFFVNERLCTCACYCIIWMYIILNTGTSDLTSVCRVQFLVSSSE